MARQTADQSDQHHGHHQGPQAPIPVHRAGALVSVGQFFGKKNQQRVRDVRHGPEQPDYHGDGNHGWQYDGQAGEEIGPPANQRFLLVHCRTLGLQAGLLKGNSGEDF